MGLNQDGTSWDPSGAADRFGGNFLDVAGVYLGGDTLLSRTVAVRRLQPTPEDKDWAATNLDVIRGIAGRGGSLQIFGIEDAGKDSGLS